MKKLTVLIIGLAVVAALALAQPGPGTGQGTPGCGMQSGKMGGGHGMWMGHRGRMGMERGMRMRGEMLEKLELSDDQKAKFEKMRSDFQLQMIDQQAKIRKSEVQLRDLMRDDKSATSAVEAQIDQVAKYRAEAQKMRFRHHADFLGLLTDKQKATLKEMRMKGPGPLGGDMDDESEGEGQAPHPDGREG